METETSNITGVNNAEVTPTTVHAPHGHNSKSKRPFSRKRAVAVVVLILLLAFGVFWSWWLFGRNTNYNEDKAVNTKGFQAVFLTNGQVYFGKLGNLNHKYVTITDIYYLQVQQSSESTLQNASSSANSNSQVSLAKLGSELHGPEDKMSISSDQVLFWENLKSDSKVVQAIQKYQSQ